MRKDRDKSITKNQKSDFRIGVIEDNFHMAGKLSPSKERLNRSSKNKLAYLILNKKKPDNLPGLICLTLRKENRPSKIFWTEKKQLFGKLYFRILRLNKSKLFRLDM